MTKQIVRKLDSRFNNRICKHAIEILLGITPTYKTDKDAELTGALVQDVIRARAESKGLSASEIMNMLKETCLIAVSSAQQDDKMIPVALRSLKILSELESSNHLSEARIKTTVAIMKQITPHDLLGMIQDAEDFDTLKQALIDYDHDMNDHDMNDHDMNDHDTDKN